MNKIVVIVGPTGVGKTKLSISLAKRLNGEIINADSTQVYLGLDIATAKVKDMGGVRHHLIDIKPITYDYSVYEYQKDGRLVIEKLMHEGKTPIVVGGTGLYIKALLYNYDFKEEMIKYDYEIYYDRELYQKLILVDPKTDIHPNNRKRIIRAINYYDIYNKPFSSKTKSEELLYDTVFIGLTTSRDYLYETINNRVDQMIDDGLIEEAYNLYKGDNRGKAVMTPIGYKELFLYFDGLISKEEAILKIKQNSRHYAKRQYTWFNNQMDIKWFDVDYDDFDKTINSVYEYIKKA